jgi:hypothetical protein
MNKLASGSAREREKRLRISLQLGPGKDSSLATRVAFKTLRGLSRDRTQPRSGQSGQMIRLSVRDWLTNDLVPVPSFPAHKSLQLIRILGRKSDDDVASWGWYAK